MNSFELWEAVVKNYNCKIAHKVSKSFREEILIDLRDSFREVIEEDANHTIPRIFIDNPLKGILR